MLKQFTYNRINQNGLSHLVADDLFYNSTKQIFDAKTGKHICYINEGKVIELIQIDEVIELPAPDRNQLSLF